MKNKVFSKKYQIGELLTILKNVTFVFENVIFFFTFDNTLQKSI